MTQIENIFLLLVGFIGVLLIYSMVYSIRTNKLVNGFLIFNFACVSSRFIIISSYNLKLQDFISDDNPTYKILYLLVFPSSYLYFKSIVFDVKFKIETISKHLIFPLLIFVFNLLLLFGLIEKSIVVFSLNFIFILSITLFYLIKTFLFLFREIWSKKLQIDKAHYKLMKNWTIFYFFTCFLIVVRLVVSLIFEYTQGFSMTGNQLSFSVAAIFWLLIFLKIFKTPEILFGIPNISVKTKFFNENELEISNLWIIDAEIVKSKRDQDLQIKVEPKVLNLIKEVEYFAQEKKVFNTSKFSVYELSLLVGVPESHLNYLFRYHCIISFVEYKNKMRINSSLEFINNGYLQTNTLDSLAKEVGFASYSPFFNAFKKQCGVSPNEFLNKVNSK